VPAAALAVFFTVSAACAADPLGSGFGSGASYAPSVPVSAFARPASWLDPSRLHISASMSVGSGFGQGTSALQVTTLSYNFAAPAWMSVSLGNAFGSGSMNGKNSFFLEGLDAGYRPFSSMEIQVHYRNYRSPLQYQYQPGGFGPWIP
jgi:hypothetical protein